MPTDHERLHRLIEKLCIIEGDFVLSTGAKSRYYFDCKTVALDGEGLTLIAGEFLREIEKLPVKPTAIGGLTMGADFITAAVIMMSYQTGGKVLKGSIARKEPKKHGTVVDREQGGKKTLEEKYKHVRTLFKTSDFPKLASQLRKEMVL